MVTYLVESPTKGADQSVWLNDTHLSTWLCPIQLPIPLGRISGFCCCTKIEVLTTTTKAARSRKKLNKDFTSLWAGFKCAIQNIPVALSPEEAYKGRGLSPIEPLGNQIGTGGGMAQNFHRFLWLMYIVQYLTAPPSPNIKRLRKPHCKVFASFVSDMHAFALFQVPLPTYSRQ